MATVQVIRLDWRENTELVIAPLDYFQIDLCLSARLQGMSVRYPQHWGATRFGRVGELMLIPPGEKVIARCDFPDGAGHYTHASTVIKLAPALVHEWSGPDTAWGAERLEPALDISDQSIYSLMSRVSREALNAMQTLGYASQSSFSYAFRRATGGTPARFCQLV